MRWPEQDIGGGDELKSRGGDPWREKWRLSGGVGARSQSWQRAEHGWRSSVSALGPMCEYKRRGLRKGVIDWPLPGQELALTVADYFPLKRSTKPKLYIIHIILFVYNLNILKR